MVAADPHAALLRKEIEGQIAKAFQRLNEREIMVLAMRNGFQGPCMTLRAIGEQIGVTTERVRQMESKASRIIRQSKVLDGYLQSGAFD